MQQLSISNTLISLRLLGIRFTTKALNAIGKGIELNHTLKVFEFTHSFLASDGFHLLSQAIATHQCLEILKLRKDAICDSHAVMIKAIIVKHANRRNDIKWMKSLRDSKPEKTDIKGMLQINISDNHLTANFIEAIADTLKVDRYLKVLNISHNCIDEQGCSLLVGVLKENRVIIALDIRGNPGYNASLENKIAAYLIRNIAIQCKHSQVN
jgi:Ran GTPase-activating protein (RanGAP) involved in mRNA processing and transport